MIAISVLLLAVVSASNAHRYSLQDETVGEAFFYEFEHESIDDPTHGRVEYVNELTARALNLSYASEDHFIMRADHTTRLSSQDKGRKSVRVQSRKSYSHGTVIVADVEHMPVGCGTWPALWNVGDNWPHGGEIDLIEGVNNMSPNLVSLHSSEGCQQPSTRQQKGSPVTNDCNANVNFNTGCGVKINDNRSYGVPFNAVGGGWYALERTSHDIKAWFWARDDPNVPKDVQKDYHHSRGLIQVPILGGIGPNEHHPDTLVIDTSKWGIPDVRFVNDQCDIPRHFKRQKIVINLTFCGDWAGEYFTYLASGCPSNCIDYVNSNPAAFADAFWDIRSIRVYGAATNGLGYECRPHIASQVCRPHLDPPMLPRVPRGLSVALNASGKYAFKSPEFEVDYLVVGGGVVGLAIARSLTLNRLGKSVYLVERHSRVGEETSSRNSEVIHGGFYYPESSLKTRLCIRGRQLLYQYCDTHAIPYKKTGKLVVGLEHQKTYLKSLFDKSQSLRWPKSPSGNRDAEENIPAVPAKLLTGDEARELEPDLSPAITAALLSNDTGIIDSHTFMESLERDISEGESGSVVCGTSVVRVDPAKDGWVVQMNTKSQEADGEGSGETESVLAKTLINSSGLSGPFILNSLRSILKPPAVPMPIWYAKGSYASYHGPGVSNVKHLIYPVPETGTKQHGFAGLGTHLTLDLGGNIKFGPDIEWIEPNIRQQADQESGMVFSEDAVDFWISHLVASSEQMPFMFASVQQYLPGISPQGLQPDYVGIRPKLGPPSSGFQDFVFMKERSGKYMGGSISSDEGGIILNLLGIESPGLTSSLAIAEMVETELLPNQ